MRVLVTGASGHIGSAVVSELILAGHEVVGLARSDTSATTVAALGASVCRGDLDDLDGLREAAMNADGVIHLAFDHDQMRAGNMAAAVATEVGVVNAFGDALKGSGKPLVGVSGTLVLASLGRVGTEEDLMTIPGTRNDVERTLIAFAQQGIRSSVVRIPPITHGTVGWHGFARTLIPIARATGVSGYVGTGENRWPAVHTLDLARLYLLALENAPAGTVWHGVADEGIRTRDLAQAIGGHVGVPAGSIPTAQVASHFGFLAMMMDLDDPTSALTTRRELGWTPTHVGMLADPDFDPPAPH